jgi:hypothetical protein
MTFVNWYVLVLNCVMVFVASHDTFLLLMHDTYNSRFNYTCRIGSRYKVMRITLKKNDSFKIGNNTQDRVKYRLKSKVVLFG